MIVTTAYDCIKFDGYKEIQQLNYLSESYFYVSTISLDVSKRIGMYKINVDGMPNNVRVWGQNIIELTQMPNYASESAYSESNDIIYSYTSTGSDLFFSFINGTDGSFLLYRSLGIGCQWIINLELIDDKLYSSYN